MNKTKTYYQPELKTDGALPEELSSFHAFLTVEDCYQWLIIHDYEPENFDIIEYHDDEIEDVTILDEYGDEVEINGEDEEEAPAPDRFLSEDLANLLNGKMTLDEFRSYWGSWYYNQWDATLFNKKFPMTTILCNMED